MQHYAGKWLAYLAQVQVNNLYSAYAACIVGARPLTVNESAGSQHLKTHRPGQTPPFAHEVAHTPPAPRPRKRVCTHDAQARTRSCVRPWPGMRQKCGAPSVAWNHAERSGEGMLRNRQQITFTKMRRLPSSERSFPAQNGQVKNCACLKLRHGHCCIVWACNRCITSAWFRLWGLFGDSWGIVHGPEPLKEDRRGDRVIAFLTHCITRRADRGQSRS